MVQFSQCWQIKGSFRKIGEEIFNTIRKFHLDQTDIKVKKCFLIRGMNKIKRPLCMEPDEPFRMICITFFPAASHIEFERGIEFNGIRKEKALEKRITGIRRVYPEKKLVP